MRYEIWCLEDVNKCCYVLRIFWMVDCRRFYEVDITVAKIERCPASLEHSTG